MNSSMMNFDGMRNFIIENELTDNVVIALHPESFDALALDYIRIHETIERPFEILGIAIVEDTLNTVPKNHFRIIEL